jgi:PAS domain S-box-containing protein
VLWGNTAIVIWLYERTLQSSLARSDSEVAQRRQAQEALQTANNFLRQVVDSAPYMIFVVDSEGRAVFANQYTAQYYGSTPEALIARPTQAVHAQPVESDEYLRDNLEVIRTRRRLVREETNTAPDGRQHRFHTTKVPLERPDGRVEVLGISIDITEKVEAEAALRESEARLNLALEAARMGVWEWNLQTNAVYSSPALNAIIGLDRSTTTFESYRDLIHPADVERVTHEIQQAVDRRSPFVSEFRLKRPDGRTIWLGNTGQVKYDAAGQAVRMVGTVQEVTERKQTEMALLYSEERYRRLFDDVPVPIWEMDFSWARQKLGELQAQGIVDLRTYLTSHPGLLKDCAERVRILDLNNAAVRMFEAGNKEQLLNFAVRIASPDDQARFLEDLIAIAEGRVSHTREGRDTTLSGRPIEISLSWSVLPAHAQDFSRLIVTTVDITERRQAEQALRRLVEELSALYQTSLDIISSDSLPDLLNTIVARAVDLLGGRSGGMYLYDPQLRQARCVVSYNTPVDYSGTVLQYGEGAAGTVAVTGEPLIIDDYQAWAGRARSFAGDDFFGALISAPMRWQGQVIGVIHVLDAAGQRQFTDDDLKLLIPFANQAAVAVANARLFEETHRRLDELEILQSVSAALRQAHSAHEMLPIFLKHSVRAVDAQLGSIYLYDEASGDWVSHGWVTAEGEWLPAPSDVRHPAGEGLTGHVGETGEVYLLNDWRSDPLISVRPGEQAMLNGLHSAISLPLHAEDRIIGVMHIWYAWSHAFSDGERRLLTAVANMAGNALQRARLHEETQRRLERLSSLQQIDQLIASNLDLRLTLNILLGTILQQLQVDAAAVLLYRPELQNLEFVASQGFLTQALQFTNLRLGQGFAGRAALERRTVHISDPVELRSGFLRSPEFVSEQFVAYIGIPLIAKGNTIGVLEIYQRQPLHLDKEWMGFLDTLAGQAAIAIDNVQLFENLRTSNLQLNQAYDATIAGWAQALELRDMETVGHSNRTVELTLRLARRLRLKKSLLPHIRRGALLHDIGKMGVPDAILQKPGALTREERSVMQQHPLHAYRWLSQIPFLQDALDIPYCHHEKWDGTGYPRGLKGAEIPLAARIFAVVDMWDAVTSDRPYRAAWTKAKARRYIREQSGRHFDPQVVRAFLEMIGDE